jgi:hypothetical protein
MMPQLRLCFLGLLLAAAGTGCPSSTPRSTPPTPRSADEQKAMDLAQKYVDKAGLNWGEPKEVTPQQPAGTFWISYPTPEDEVKLLGERVLSVDVRSGEVKPLPRK